MNIALKVDIIISASPNLLCNLSEKTSNIRAVTNTTIAKIYGERPIRTYTLVKRYKIEIHIKSKIALVALAIEYILFNELFTFKKSIKKSTMQIPNTTFPSTIFLLKNKNAKSAK